ncbi:MarR family transcriptional regulator [Frondihabitans sp. 4ASC-45]|uniref:MarR family transcriptional regulator n=1 Tax=Frondihabitans sp. 4ASC-45 TaxID=3111636 RepID=UPI003C2589FD
MEAYVDAVRELSRAAFGQKYRLECMLAIAESGDGMVTLSTLAKALDVSTSNVQDPIKALLATGLISPLDSGDSRSKFYVRNASSAWEWCRELAQRARETAMLHQDEPSRST